MSARRFSSSSRRARALASAALVLSLGGCDLGVRLSGVALDTVGRKVEEPPPPVEPPVVAADPLGPKPTLEPPASFEPAAPVVFRTASGLSVWLVERPALPLVAFSLVVPTGALSDPAGKPGTMQLAVDMMDEGAGKRGAVELSDALADLGASLSLGVSHDASYVELSALSRNLEPSFALFADVVARPRFEPKELRRVHRLWKDNLAKRGDDPSAVGSLVAASLLYGSGPGYGQPASGLYSKADAVDLASVRAAYERAFRPEQATLVVVGRADRARVEALVEAHLGGWKAKGPLPAPPVPSKPRAERPKLVLVDRPGSVQSVIVTVRDGVPSGDERAPLLELLNTALGGSFTSRLNLNLREAKGWTYGVRSAFTRTRGQGAFVVRTSVEAKHTADAVREILGELGSMAEEGLAPAEVDKVKAQDRAELVEAYETVSGTASRLASLLAAGLPPGFDAAATRLRQGSTREDLARLARAQLHPSACSIVIVGDASTVTKQLAEAGLPAPERWSNEGQPLR